MVGRMGQTAYAIQAGKVWQASWDGGGWAVGGGYSVIVQHGPTSRPTMKTSYCHGQGLYVKPGQLILPGTRLLNCDNKGNSTGSHCHHTVELWDAGSGKWIPVDPHSVYPVHTWKNGNQSSGSRAADGRTKGAVRITGEYVHFRSGATTTAGIISTLRKGTVLVYDGVVTGQIPAGFKSNRWYRAFWYSGTGGWKRGYAYSGLSVLQ